MVRWKKVGLEIAGEGLSNRLVKPTTKFGGGSLILWSCMSWDGMGFMWKIGGRMDEDLYVNILKDELLNSIEHFSKIVSDIIFQQDNDSSTHARKLWTGLITII